MHFSSGQWIVYVDVSELSCPLFVSHQQTMMSTRSAPSTRLPPPDFHTLSCFFVSVMAIALWCHRGVGCGQNMIYIYSISFSFLATPELFSTHTTVYLEARHKVYNHHFCIFMPCACFALNIWQVFKKKTSQFWLPSVYCDFKIIHSPMTCLPGILYFFFCVDKYMR